MLEARDKSLAVIAEDLRGLRSEFNTFKLALEDVSDDIKLMKPAIHTLVKDVKKLTEGNERIEGHVVALEKRLTALETSST